MRFLSKLKHVPTSARLLSSYKPAPQSVHFPARKDGMLPPDTFAGRTAFITGGGTGLGRGMAEMLAKLGASVVISSRKQDVLDKAVDEMKKSTGNQKILGVAADVRDPESVAKAVSKTESTFDLPTLILNNAAGNFISPTERLSSNAFGTVVDIVLKGSANVTLETGKRLIAAGKGGVYLAITTIYAESGSGFVVPSACAKAGVETMIKSLSSEWGRYGIRLNAIAPGPIMTKGAFSRLDPTGQFIQEGIKGIPTGRIGEVSEIANLAAYLMSDYASWISGAIIRMDGGEYYSLAGEFNRLRDVSKEQWDILEQMVRQVKGS